MDRDQVLRLQVDRFFRSQSPETWAVVCAYVEAEPLKDGQDPLSMRAMDYFVRTYIHQKLCVSTTPDGVKHNLKAEFDQIKAVRHKDYLDPFRRSQRQDVEYHGRTLSTTYAQLAFFMWCIQTGALDFVHTHRADILANKREADAQARRARHDEPTPPPTPMVAYGTGIRNIRI